MNKETYHNLQKDIRDSIPEDQRINFDVRFAAQEKNTSTALILSIIFGTLGIDRLYIGKNLQGIVKMFTLGLLGLWTVIDWFIISSATRKVNINCAKTIASINGAEIYALNKKILNENLEATNKDRIIAIIILIIIFLAAYIISK